MRLYSELASWFHLITHPDSYKEEAAHIVRLVDAARDGPADTLLELGCGGGNNASHLKARFVCTLTDVSEAMLDVSRGINPECVHIAGDMRTLRLGRSFDVVLVHDAIDYMTTEEDLRAAIETAAVHARPGGLVVLIPDAVAETFAPGTSHGGHDAADGRSARYLEWTHHARDGETAYDVDYAVLIHEPGQPMRVAQDRHRIGLFPRSTWLAAMEAAGLDVLDVPVPDPFEDEHVVFVARRSAGGGLARRRP